MRGELWRCSSEELAGNLSGSQPGSSVPGCVLSCSPAPPPAADHTPLPSTPTLTPAPPAAAPTPLPSTPTPTPAPPAATATPTEGAERTDKATSTDLCPTGEGAIPSTPDRDLPCLVHVNSAFAFDLYRALGAGGGNLLFSPHSVSTSMAMAYAGGRGDTERQMARTLHFYLPQDRLHSAFGALGLALTDRTQKEEEGAEFLLNVAGSVWAQEGHGLLPGYIDTLAHGYGEGVRPADFARDPEAARARINDWLADETGEGITDLIPPGAITALTRLVLANAIHLRAAWESAFDERATRDRPFHLLDESIRDVPMMRRQADLRYGRGDGYQAAELPYQGGDVAMTILVPEGGRFGEFEASLTGDTVQSILAGLEHEPVRLTMPSFEMESAFSLPDTLSAMGMPDAFDDGAADFSGMDGRLCRARGDICLLISDALHKAFISVDEAGTEAAAATAVIIGVTRAVEVAPEPIEMVVDRPFVFIIRHEATGAILFVGRVLDP